MSELGNIDKAKLLEALKANPKLYEGSLSPKVDYSKVKCGFPHGKFGILIEDQAVIIEDNHEGN